MSVFGDLKSDGLEQSEDRLGGFAVLPSDAYDGTIMLAYAGQSAKGARFVNIEIDSKGKKYSETVYVTNQKGENFFMNKQDPTKKVGLPGFTTINEICIMATDKPLSEQQTEDKMVNVYDPDAKKQLPKSVPVLVELIGKDITLGILNILENKTEKNDSTGNYQPIAEERNSNQINKVFHNPSHITLPEALAAQAAGTAPVADFYDKWVEKNRGVTQDRRTIKDGVSGVPKSGKPGQGAPAAAAKTSSLFSK